VLACAQLEQVTKTLLAEVDVTRDEVVPKRKERECLPVGHFALVAHEVHGFKKAFGCRLEVPKQRIVVPFASSATHVVHALKEATRVRLEVRL